jgi:phosphoenolpyruvate synthase/pyruvate phosphate dikinase
MEQFTCPLGAVGRGDRDQVGGKAAALGELTAAGIPVPPGFAVTTGAFRRALAAVDPGGLIPVWMEGLPPADPAAIAEASAQVRERILTAALPSEVREEIVACYQALAVTAPPAGVRPAADAGAAGGTGAGGPGADGHGAAVPVAVRSSATGEDSDEASFAGLADTYLWVQGQDEVPCYVRRCWASLYSAEAVSYRRHRQVPERGLAMAVVVQAMVDPRCAGVMFTRSPVTGDPSVVVVEASWGLGSALVSGEVTPDSYVVSKVTGEILKRAVATKRRAHRRDASGTGVCGQDVPGPLRDVPCLTDAEIRALALLGRRVAEHYGSPQDIEWALTGGPPGGNAAGPGGAGQPDEAARRLVLLQSRPETVWSRRPAAPLAAPKARPYDHVLDWLSGPGRPGAGT